MELLNKAMDMVDKAEVYRVKSNSIPVKFTAGELESVKSYETSGAALRVINDGRLGFSTTTDLSDVDEVLNRGLETEEIGEKVGFDFPKPAQTPSKKTNYPQTAKLSTEKIMRLGQKVIDELAAFNEELDVNVSLQRAAKEITIVNSNGLNLQEKRTSISISLEVKRVGAEDIFSFYDSCKANSLDRLDVDGLIERAKQKLKWAELSSSVQSGNYPVIFTTRGLMVLLVPLIFSFDGMNVYQGTSKLGNSLDEQALAPELTIGDGGFFSDSPLKVNFDDEGVPATQKKLVSNGVIKNFLYDMRSSDLAGKSPTGNGVKGGLRGDSDFRSQPSSGPLITVIQSGEKSFGEMISGIDRGLLVDQVLGLGQGNVLSGEFSNNVSVAYKIEDGAVVGRVKNTMIAGNVFDILEENIALSSKSEWVGGKLKGPAIMVDGLSVIQKD